LIVNFATLLTSEQVERVHEASLEILEHVGLLVRNERARKRLVQHGCRVDSETHIVKFPRHVIEHFRAAYPPTFTFHGRDPHFDRTIPDDGPLVMTGSSAPNIIDPISQRERRARSEDMARIAHLFNELPALDIFSVSVLCDDAPPGHFSLSRYYPALKNTVKPVRGNVPNVEEAQKIIKLGFLVTGNEAAYREHPLITHHYCTVVSPLTLDFDSTELLMFLTEEDLPGYATIVPNAGLTSAEKAREVYKYYYHLHYPHDEPEWGRPQRLSTLYPRLQALGAVFGEKNGWERANHFEPGQPWRQAGADQREWGWDQPPYFEQTRREHQAVRQRVGLLDMTSFGKIDVRGPGALALLQYLAGNNIDKPTGSLTYTQFLNERGGIESDVTIARLAETQFRVITGTAFAARDLGWLRMHLPNDGSVEIQDVTDDWACLSLWGPRARDVLQAVTSSDVSNAAFPYMTAQTIDIKGIAVWAQRISYAGELGWELYIVPEQAVTVWDVLMAVGQAFGIQPVGYKALESLRLEKGYRYWSSDITPSENPYEAGLGFAVRLNKGDFMGRDALLKSKERGIRQRLCTLTFDGEPGVIYGGEAVYSNGQVVGRIRSGGYGYTVGKNIGLCYLPMELAEIGIRLEIELFGERIPAEVAPDMLYDANNQRCELNPKILKLRLVSIDT